jgi:ATP-binding cassette subfamily F protein uup
LQVLYFDQLRAQIDPAKSVRDNIAGGQEWVEVGGHRTHVMSYLQNFLFDPQRARIEAGKLSGGERNRLLLAKLFTQPGNVLVLDEPTNDLDVETLTLLEELLVDFEGTVLVVSHDREFLDNVADSVLAIGPEGAVEEFVGGWSDWKRQQDARDARAAEALAKKPAANAGKVAVSAETFVTPKKKLSFKEQKELEGLPARIEILEKEQADLLATMNTPEFYKQAQAEMQKASARQGELERELLEAYARWEALGERAG